jgi:hypothetical protein
LIGVVEECRVVATRFIRAVLLPHSGCAVVEVAGVDARPVEGVDLLARAGDECDVHRSARLAGCLEHDEIRELRAAFCLPERWDCERFEHGFVERDARSRIADADLDVVEDDPRPVPVDGHGPTIAV